MPLECLGIPIKSLAIPVRMPLECLGIPSQSIGIPIKMPLGFKLLSVSHFTRNLMQTLCRMQWFCKQFSMSLRLLIVTSRPDRRDSIWKLFACYKESDADALWNAKVLQAILHEPKALHSNRLRASGLRALRRDSLISLRVGIAWELLICKPCAWTVSYTHLPLPTSSLV